MGVVVGSAAMLRRAGVRTVSLPKDHQVRAISDRYVYVTHEDEDGFQVLGRYPRPR
jgi:hypothetical protein